VFFWFLPLVVYLAGQFLLSFSFRFLLVVGGRDYGFLSLGCVFCDIEAKFYFSYSKYRKYHWSACHLFSSCRVISVFSLVVRTELQACRVVFVILPFHQPVYSSIPIILTSDQVHPSPVMRSDLGNNANRCRLG
jgi:hypothetical protein